MIPKDFLKYGMFPFIKEQKMLLSTMILSITISFTIITLIIPLIYSNMSVYIDKVPFHSKVGFNFLSIQNYMFCLLFVFFIYLVFAKIRNYIETKITYFYPIYLRKKIIKKIIYKYRQDYKEQNMGVLIPKIIEITICGVKCLEHFLQIFQNSVGLISILIGILFINYRMGLLFLIFLFVFYALSYYRYNYTMHDSVKSTRFFYQTTDKLNDDFQNLINTYINNQENTLLERQYNFQDKYLKQGYNLSKRQGKIISYQLCWQFLFLVIFFYFGFKLYKKKKIKNVNLLMSILLIIYSLTMVYDINNNFWYLIYETGPLVDSGEFIRDIFTFKSNDGHYKGKLNGNIEFKNVYFKYNKDNYIINNFSLSLKKGDTLGIIGRSGSGKTTIMKLLIRLYKVNSGKIIIDNYNINDININNLRENIVYVNQNTRMYNNTIIENIKYGNNKNDNYIKNIIKKYKITVFDSLKNGIYNNVGVSGGEISLGMQKVIIILRGILRDSNIIIFDEPLSSLDKKTRYKILKLIKNECKNKTVLIITHDSEILPYCNKTIDFNKMNIK